MMLPRQALLAWSLLVTLLLTYYSGVYVPLAESRDLAVERLHATRDRVQRVKGMIAERAQLEAGLGQAERARQQLEKAFIKAPSQSVATATLQSLVSQAVSAAGASQTSIQPLAESSEEAFTKLALTAQIRGSYAAVHGLLYALESVNPRIFIDEILLQTRAAGRRNASFRAQQRRSTKRRAAKINDIVSARIRVSAYTLAP
jgi:general secretion pathway protein M